MRISEIPKYIGSDGQSHIGNITYAELSYIDVAFENKKDADNFTNRAKTYFAKKAAHDEIYHVNPALLHEKVLEKRTTDADIQRDLRIDEIEKEQQEKASAKQY